MMIKLSTPPLAPKVVAMLAQWRVETVADLCAFNPCRAFLLLKKSGLSVTQSVFWHLVALCEGTMARDLSVQQRAYWQKKLLDYPVVDVFPSDEEMGVYMLQALQQAQQAAKMGEIPVGAVVVYQGNIIAQGHNECVSAHSVCRHAEIQALERAGQVLGNYRLSDCDLYVSLEPCVMCAGAIMQARIRRLIFATDEPKMGASGSILNLFENKKLNAHTAVHSGVMAVESRAILQNFFAMRRKSFV